MSDRAGCARRARARVPLRPSAGHHARALVLAVLLLVGLWPVAAHAAPALAPAARAGRITVVAEAGLGDTAGTLAEGAEAALTRIAADLVDLPVPRTIEIRLVRDAADLDGIAPAGRGAPAWAIGVAYPDLGVISIALRRGAQPVDAMGTLRHELAHIALGTALGPRAPRWLHEGFAYQHSAEWSWDRTETLAGMAWMGGIVDLDELEQGFPREELPAHRAYAQSYDFVGFLSRRGRWEDKYDDGDRWPFRRFLTEIERTGDLDVAAKTAFGRPLRALFEEWRADLTTRYMLAPIGLLGLAVWVLASLLLVLAFLRKRRLSRRKIAQWDEEERQRIAAEKAREAAAAARYGWSEPIGGAPAEATGDGDGDAEDGDTAPPPTVTRWLN